jgi:hypothetical protein
MANMGKQYVSSRQGTNLGQRKSIFEPSKFPQPSPNITPSPETTDLSGYRQPQQGEMMANVMDSLSTSKSASPPNYITGKQLPAPKRQEREINNASVNQLKAPPRQSNLSEKPVQKQEESIPNQTGLPDALKAGIENLSGYSLDNVRVHYNSSKPAQLRALAYTQGTDIHVAPGQEKHLPHEAWHVVQQMQGRVKPTMQMKGVQINDDEGLEREADVMGEKIITDKLANILRQKGGEVQNKFSLLQQPPIDLTVQLKERNREHIDNVPCNSVVQRVIGINGQQYNLADKDKFYQEHKEEEVKEIERLLKNADFQMDKRTIDGALADERTILISKQYYSEDETYYDIDCKEAYVKHEEGKASREAGKIPLYVTKPETGNEEIRIAGLIMCIGVIIEVTDEEDKIVGAAGGHFVTPTMLTEMGLMSEGNDFIQAIMKLVDSTVGKKQFSLFYQSEENNYTKDALVVLEHTFSTHGYQKKDISKSGSTVSYSFNAEGEGVFNF